MDVDDDEGIEDALGLISSSNLIYERRHAVRMEPPQTRRRQGPVARRAGPTSGPCP